VAAAAAATAGLSERVGAARGISRICFGSAAVEMRGLCHKSFSRPGLGLVKIRKCNIGASWALGSAK
jgi:hypothetical protein